MIFLIVNAFINYNCMVKKKTNTFKNFSACVLLNKECHTGLT